MSNELYIIHYGVGHDKGGHSGRYPWGSGENPRQSDKNFKKIVNTNLNEARKKSKKIASFQDQIAIRKDSKRFTPITWGFRGNRNAIKEAIQKRYDTNPEFKKKIKEAKQAWIDAGKENARIAKSYVEFKKKQNLTGLSALRNKRDIERFIQKSKRIPTAQASLDDVEFATKYIFDDNVVKNKVITAVGAVAATIGALKIADTVSGKKVFTNRVGSSNIFDGFVNRAYEANAMAGAKWAGSDWERIEAHTW